MYVCNNVIMYACKIKKRKKTYHFVEHQHSNNTLCVVAQHIFNPTIVYPTFRKYLY